MGSLEFINKLIKDTEDSKERFLECLRNFPNDYVFRRCVENRERELQSLQQIKTELKAWEVVKKHLEYFPDDYWNGITEEIITMTSQIDKKDYPTIKKALEVEDE